MTKRKVLKQSDIKNIESEMISMGDNTTCEDIVDSIKSRYKILYIVTPEEERVLHFFKMYAMSQTYEVQVWDCNRGLMNLLDGKQVSSVSSEITEPEAILDFAINYCSEEGRETGDGVIYLFMDFHHFLDPAIGVVPKLERKMKLFASVSKKDCIVIVSPQFVTPPSLEKSITMFEFPYPNEQEIKKCIDKIAEYAGTSFPCVTKTVQEKGEELVRNMMGLTITEIKNACAKSLRKKKDFCVEVVAQEKEQIIRKSGILEFCKPEYDMDDVGGLDRLKSWLALRVNAFSKEAKAFGLPTPKGILLCGIPGGGKSLCAKAISSQFGYPLLRLDMGSIFASRVGESERRIREVLRISEAISPVILWTDEIEKGISGVKSSGSSDAGTASRVVGTLLTWMQDKRAPVFIVATANNKDDIPPEFMRAGRFDEVFFIDVPNQEERVDIFKKLLRRKNRNLIEQELIEISECCDGYVGAEIEKAIDNTLFLCFNEGKREMTAYDLMGELKKFVPLSRARSSELEQTREWAMSGGAIIANSGSKTSSKVSVVI